MGHYTGTTVAFSHKGGFWKTRYSYTPTCYSTIDNVMITNNETVPLDPQPPIRHFWEHNVNNLRNNFYRGFNNSSIRVVSNQDPSSVKLFKAISVESSTGGVSASFTSNPEQEVGAGAFASNTDFQVASMANNFTLKEGIYYAEIPRSINVSSSHLDFVCMIDEVIDSDSDIYESVANYGVLPNVALLPTRYGWNANTITLPNTSIPSGYQTVAVFVDSNNAPFYLYYNLAQGWQLEPFDDNLAGGFSWINTVYIHSYNADNTITFATAAVDSDGTPAEVISDFEGIQSSPFDTLFVGDQWSDIKLFSATEPEVNGDPMRGKFLTTDLFIGGGYSFELHAINKDYEPTKLDGSHGSSKSIATGSN